MIKKMVKLNKTKKDIWAKKQTMQQSRTNLTKCRRKWNEAYRGKKRPIDHQDKTDRNNFGRTRQKKTGINMSHLTLNSNKEKKGKKEKRRRKEIKRKKMNKKAKINKTWKHKTKKTEKKKKRIKEKEK